MLKPDGIYFAYLRKSREDREAEKNGAEDTLSRHEYIITELAQRYSVKIIKWYREVVSGETIIDRPEMLALLHDVETIHPDGVFVVEPERLSRGNPQDQGRVMDTFKYSGSLIITPMKIYDLTKENDEEWMDFGLLRSRMEYRTIKRRLHNGRMVSSMQGKFIGSDPPYGWQREKLKGEKGYTLIPNPETAPVLKLMYELAYSGNADTDYTPVGITTIARILDDRGIAPPRGTAWSPSSISLILKNPAHIGMVRIGHRKEVRHIINGELMKSRPINSDSLLIPARWKGQIDPEVFEAVCSRFKKRATIDTFKNITNPLASIIRCSVCGRPMTRRPHSKRQPRDMMICTTRNCPTVGAYCSLVEKRLIQALEGYLADYQLHIDDDNGIDWNTAIAEKENTLAEYQSKEETLNKQYTKVCTLFEQDIYDLDTYLSRSQELKAELSSVRCSLLSLRKELEQLRESSINRKEFVPYFESVLQSYKDSTDPKYKNQLLKEIVSSVDYTKTTKGGRNGKYNDAFELDIHINLMPHPKNS